MRLQKMEMASAHVYNEAGAAEALVSKLRQARRRVRVLLILRGVSQGLLVAVMGLCGLAVLSKMQQAALLTFARLLGLLTAGTTIGALFSFRPRLNDLDVARLLESRAALQERLSSALEFRQQGMNPTSPFYGEQWADANRCAAQIDVKAFFPARTPRALPYAALLLALCCLVLFAPGLPGVWPQRGQPPQDTEAVRTAAVAIERAAEQAGSDARQPSSPQTKQAAQEVKSLAARMKLGGMDKKQSLVALHKLMQQFARQEKTGNEAVSPSSPEQSAPQDARSSSRTPDNATGSRQTVQAGKAVRPPNAPESQTGNAGSKQSEAKDKTSREKQSQQNTRMQAATPGGEQKARQTAGQMPKPGQMQARHKGQTAQSPRRSSDTPDGTKPNTENAIQNAAALQKLTQALKAGQQALTSGSKSGAGGKGAGQGTAGSGNPTRAMPGQANTQSRLVSSNRNQNRQLVSRTADARNPAQDTTASLQSSKYRPNALVRGIRTAQGAEMQTRSTGATSDPARSRSPYFKAYEAGRRQAESALDKESVPAAYKQQVRDYFNSIHP